MHKAYRVPIRDHVGYYHFSLFVCQLLFAKCFLWVGRLRPCLSMICEYSHSLCIWPLSWFAVLCIDLSRLSWILRKILVVSSNHIDLVGCGIQAMLIIYPISCRTLSILLGIVLDRIGFVWSPLGVIPEIFGPPDRWIGLIIEGTTYGNGRITWY